MTIITCIIVYLQYSKTALWEMISSLTISYELRGLNPPNCRRVLDKVGTNGTLLQERLDRYSLIYYVKLEVRGDSLARSPNV
jgi:hypothetical protein